MGVKEEKARQTCFCFTKTGRALKPVKASRCTHMFDENVEFSKRVTKAEAEIKALKKAADVFIASTEKTLSTPLPGDWEQDAHGGVHKIPASGEPMIRAGQLPRTKDAEFQSFVFEPINQWQTEHNRMKGRMTELNATSLRLDEQRRKHSKATDKHIKQNVMEQDNVTAVSKGEMENPELVTARTNFQKLEMDVHRELVAQGQKARAVQEYLTTAMQIQAASLNEVAAVHMAPMMGQQDAGMQTMGMQEQSPMHMQQQSPMGGQQQPSLTQDMMHQQPMQPQVQANVPHLRT